MAEVGDVESLRRAHAEAEERWKKCPAYKRWCMERDLCAQNPARATKLFNGLSKRREEFFSHLSPLARADGEAETKGIETPACAHRASPVGSPAAKAASGAAAPGRPRSSTRGGAATAGRPTGAVDCARQFADPKLETNAGAAVDAECCVCMESAKSHVFIPCGHVCVCQGCAEQVMASSKECPMCRQVSISFYRVYM
jgi:hypothetical protein